MNFLVDFNDTATSADIQDWLAANSITVYKALPKMGTYIIESDVAPAESPLVIHVKVDENISTQLLGDVEIIPTTVSEQSTFNHDDDNWWKTACVFELDHNAPSTTFQRLGSKANVYIVDSGIDDTHPDFASTKIEKLFSFTDNFADTNGHGTALASVVVGSTLGVTNATVKSVKIFDNTKTTMISDLVAALDAVYADVIANPDKVSIVNMSWAIPKNEYVEMKIQLLINAGSIVVAAAGNSGVEIANTTPASMANVLTIGAYDMDFNPASFSNFSAISNTHGDTNYGSLDGWAPGVDIKVALVGGNIGNGSGTSVAAAIMSACIAHNSDLAFTNDGPVAFYEQSLSGLSLQKNGLLNLNDPKYTTSVNKIATFLTKVFSHAELGQYTATRVIYAGQEANGLVAYNVYTDKIELDHDLPEGLSLSNGWLVGKIVNPPTVSTVLDYIVTVTFSSGAVKSYPMKLVLANVETLPGDSPSDIELMLCTSDNNYGCTGTCPGFSFCSGCTKNSCVCGNAC